MSNLPVPVHQQVHLQVNPRKKTWKGTTDLKVVVPPGQQTIGLHCYNLAIHQVAVNGVPAQYTLYQYPSESLPDLTVEHLRKGSGKDAQLSAVSEHAYDQYVRLMHKEQEPELLVTVPQQLLSAAGTDREATPVPGPADGASTPLKTATPAAAATPPAAEAGTPAGHKAGTGRSASPALGTPLNKQQQLPQQLAGQQQQQQQQLTISIMFSKPPNSIGRDTSLLVEQQCMVANSLLRRARGWFPCVDSPLHIYTPAAPHCLPYTFDLQLTVPPSFMAVCSGLLVQQTCTVLPVGLNNAAGAADGLSSGHNGADTRVVARTFEYSVAAPVVPSQLTIAVGPFVALQYSDLLAAVGTASTALPAGAPVITVFAPVTDKAAAAVLSQQQQQPTDGSASSNDSKVNSNSSAAIKCLGTGQLRRLADTLKPLSVLLRAYDKVLSCMFPWTHLQVAVVPDGCLLRQWQAGLGSILLRESSCATDNLVLEPRVASASCLAAALAQQYFGLLLMPKGPEDTWLLRGLAGWLEGQGLKHIVGSNELHYRRWQERVWLSAVDDGEQLGPLSPVVREGDKGFTAAWGRLHGTQDLEPCPAMTWKATAVIHMLERKIGEDELRKVLERYVNGAKHAAANTAAAAAGHPDAAAAAAISSASPAPKPTAPPAAPTASGTTAGGSAAAAAAYAAATAVPASAAAAGGGGVGGVAERLMTTAKFMRTMGKKQGFKKEASGFFNRWVHGTGVPQLTACVSWDNKRSLLLLALKQAGSKAVMRGALKASEPVVLGGENTGGAAPGGRACTLKVLVRELDACEEHQLQVDASSSLSLHDIKITSKLGAQRRRMQAAAAAGARRGGGSWAAAAEDLDVSEAELRGVPILWVQVDHGGEWLAAVQLRQPAHWWSLQLEHSKDVVAQAQAVAGLAAQFGGSSSNPQLDKYIISVLGTLMRNPGVFCRVRLDAAMALGTAAGNYQNNDAAVELFKFVRERLYDPYTGLMQPNDFTDRGEALLNHGLPAALAQITMLGGYTPDGIHTQLLELLACSDNSSNAVDDGHWLAALVTALGQLRLSNAAELAKVLKELDRMLAHEAVVGTHNAVLGCACLRAITQLATQLQHSGSAVLLQQVRQLLLQYAAGTAGSGASNSSSTRQLKVTANGCLLRIAAATAEAELRDMMAGLEAAAAAAAAAAASDMQADQQQQQLYQQQLQQIAYTASYSQLLQQLLALSASTGLKPPLLLDRVLRVMLELLDAETDAVHRAEILKEALLLIGQLELQGYYDLKPTAVLPDSVTAAAATAAAAALAAAEVPAAAADVAPAAMEVDGAQPPVQGAAEPATTAPPPTTAAAAGGDEDPSTAGAGAVTAADGAVIAEPAAADGPDSNPAAAVPTAPTARQQQQQSLVVPVSVDMLLHVQQLLNSHDEPAVRQLAFMLLQKLAGQPPTLYREREEDDMDLTAAAAATTAVTAPGQTAPAAPAATADRAAVPAASGPAASGGAAPSGSMKTGMTVGGRARSSMPAASAGGMSMQHTGTTAPTKIRLGKLVGLKKPPSSPAVAGGTSSAGAPSPVPAAAAAASAAGQPGQQQLQQVKVEPGTTAGAAGQQQQQVKLEQPAAAAAAQQTPFAAVEQQQQQSKVERGAWLPPLHPAPAAAGSPAVQQPLPATVPSVAASVAHPPGAAAPALPSAAPSTAGSVAGGATAAAAAAGVPIRTKPLIKKATLPGSTGSLASSAAPVAAAAAGSSAGRTASPSPAPAAVPAAAVQQPAAAPPQQQYRQFGAGVKRAAAAAAASMEPAPSGVTAATASAATAAAAGPPAVKKMKLKKAGIPGQTAPAAAAAAATPPPAAATPPPPLPLAPTAAAPPPPFQTAAAPASAPSAAAPSASNVTASGVSGATKPKLKFKMPGFKKKE